MKKIFSWIKWICYEYFVFPSLKRKMEERRKGLKKENGISMDLQKICL